MKPKLERLTSSFSFRWLLLSGIRTMCIITIAYYIGNAITSGVSTLGSIIYSLFPVVIIGGILLLIEIRKDNFTFPFLFSIPLGIKVFKKGIILVFIGLIAGVSLLSSGLSSPVDLLMVLLVILALGSSVIFMLKGQSVIAICVFILAWPFIIFENGYGYFFFYLTNKFNELFAFDITEDIAMFVYICLLLICWIINLLMNSRRLAPASWSSGIWLFVGAGLLSTIFSPQPILSLNQFIRAILLPVLLFILFVNEVRSWNDFKKLSLSLGFTMGIITIVWLYYALYRDAETNLTLSQFILTRGGGGKILGSKYAGYNGIYYEYLSPLIIPSVLALSATAVNNTVKRFWAILVILMLTATFLTFGRNGWVATLLCLQPWVWKHRRGRLLGVLSLVCCFFLFFYFKEIFAEIFSRFNSFLSWENIQEVFHFRIWTAAVDMFLNHPWTGIGLGMFHEFSADYNLFVFIKDEFSKIIPVNVVEAHGAFFQIISELGILGLIAWCAMLWIPLRNFFSQKDRNISWSVAKSPWMLALQSYSLLLVFFFFLGPLAWWGIESPRIIIFFLWLAVLSNKDTLLKELHRSKDYVTNQSGRI